MFSDKERPGAVKLPLMNKYKKPLFRVFTAILSILTGLAMVQAPVLAQKALAQQLYNRATMAYETGNYRQALTLFRQMMQASQTGKYSDRDIAAGYLGLAETLRSMGIYEEAEEKFKVAREHSEKLKLGKNFLLSRILNDLGALCLDMGRFEEAEKYWQESEKISGNFAYYPINNQVRMYIFWGKSDEARKHLSKALEIASQKKFQHTLAVPYAQFNQAMLHTLIGNYPAAEEQYKASLGELAAQVGKDHLYYTMVQSGLAKLYCKESRFTEAESALTDILKTCRDSLGEDHPSVSLCMVELGDVLCDLGKYQEAEKLIEKSIELDKKIYNTDDNIFIARARHCLGKVKRQDGRYDEAADLIARSLVTTRSSLGAQHLETALILRDLARVYIDQGKFKEAEKSLNEARQIVDSQTGPDHPDRAELARDLGFLYMREDRLSEAEPQFKTALELSSRVLGENHAVTADSARDLGELYLKKKQYDQAVSYLKNALAIDESLYGKDAPQVAADLMSLAGALKAQDNTEESAKLLSRANGITSKLAGSNAQLPTIDVPINFDSSRDRPVREKWALAIGISSFADPSINLKFAAKDATDFRNFLVSREKFKPENVRLLTDEKATRQNIIDTLGDKWLGANVQKDDLVVVYVSSHGSGSQQDAGGVNFLVAHDTDKNSLLATGIPMQWLTKMIQEQVKSDRVVLILDVCHSGAAASGGKALSRIMGMTPTELTIGSGQMVLCSSLAEQVSWESKNYENSVFTRRLMEALRVNQDRTTLLEAYRKLKDLVEGEVLRDRANLQTPVLWNRDWVGKDPALAIDTVPPGSD